MHFNESQVRAPRVVRLSRVYRWLTTRLERCDHPGKGGRVSCLDCTAYDTVFLTESAMQECKDSIFEFISKERALDWTNGVRRTLDDVEAGLYKLMEQWEKRFTW